MLRFGLAILVAASCVSASPSPQLLGISGIKEAYNKVKSRLQCADMPNNGTCAILFDEDDCSGWQLAINEGYTELPTKTVGDFLGGSFIDNPKKNDAEAVLVRDGCVFVGYDHDKKSSRGLGDAIVVAAVGGHRYQNFDEDGFEDLDEEISSVDCVCKGFAFSKN